mgnify:CR=1 FL=1
MLRNKNDNNTIQAGITESGFHALEIPCAILIYLSQYISDVHTLWNIKKALNMRPVTPNLKIETNKNARP